MGSSPACTQPRWSREGCLEPETLPSWFAHPHPLPDAPEPWPQSLPTPGRKPRSLFLHEVFVAEHKCSELGAPGKAETLFRSRRGWVFASARREASTGDCVGTRFPLRARRVWCGHVLEKLSWQVSEWLHPPACSLVREMSWDLVPKVPEWSNVCQGTPPSDTLDFYDLQSPPSKVADSV